MGGACQGGSVSHDDELPVEDSEAAAGSGYGTNRKAAALVRTATEVERLANSEALKGLRDLQRTKPFLAQPTHVLYRLVQECEEAAKEADGEGRARDWLERIYKEVDQEEKTLAVAFALFAPPGQDALQNADVHRMLEYLGFPAGDSDVAELLKAVDKNQDGNMELDEFQAYVGKMGGSHKLFEIRRQRMAARHGTDPTGEGATEMRTNDLKSAGITEQEQAYWSLVLPRALQEFDEAAKLQACQKDAVRQIRTLAKNNHQQKLPELQRKVRDLGFKDDDLWMCLAYIRELAPIIIHLDLTKMMPFMKSDTHYRNQFETRSSGGLLKPTVREKWERDLFSGAYDGVQGFDRCKYGVLNTMNDYRGVVKCKQYGDSYLVLKDCRLRCTFSPEDSANLKSERLAVLDYYAHVLNEYSNEELKETIKIAKSGDDAILGDSSKVGDMKYKEAQIHGEIRFDSHVERVVASVRHRGRDDMLLKQICDKHGWKLSWMDEEQNRMKHEEKAMLGEGAWKEKMRALLDKGTPDVKGVPPGYCRKGCSRKVRPGKTAHGNDYTTCCRGCALGFGHELSCNNVDPELVRPGFCINGCGRPVNKGTTASGRPFTTCCRGCSMGKHDLVCGKEVAPGFCQKGCNRRASPGFSTCCAQCVKTGGAEHDPRCAG